MTSAFHSYPPRLQQAIVERLGWRALRPVQEQASQVILKGHNAVVLAPTAGGKTEAAIFPLLAKLLEDRPKGLGILYIAPIKALLNNLSERLELYTQMVGMDRFVWHGDISQSRKKAFLREPATLLMTTPESLEVMLISERVPSRALFRDVRAVVVDEVHAMAGTDRGAHLASVIERIGRHTKGDIQRIGLSATVGNPDAILGWLSGSSPREGTVVDPPHAPSRKDLKIMLMDDPQAIARSATRQALGHKSLLFCQSRALSETIADAMRGQNMEVFVHHGSVSAEERLEAEASFQRGTNTCIVCTSTLELGIDVGDLDRVLQANAPNTVSSFLQRLGRTGRRAGMVANTTFLCETPELALQAVALIELARERWVESVAPQRRAWPVVVHQILAMTLQHGALTFEDCWEHLCHAPDFADITKVEVAHLIEHMVETGALHRSGQLLSMGLEAERRFGRRNFMELYAVFSSPVLYKVRTRSKRTLGSLEQTFVDKLVWGKSAFLLSGRAWRALEADFKRHVVYVEPAPTGTKPDWGGYTPTLLGHRLCQQMASVLCQNTPLKILNAKASKAIEAMRGDLGPLLKAPGHSLRKEDGQWVWWTFAGGRVNHTLRHGLALKGITGIRADNLSLHCGEVALKELESAIETISEPGFWNDSKIQRALLASLPAYRLSKFQQWLPEPYALEMVANFMLDISGALTFLGAMPGPSQNDPLLPLTVPTPQPTPPVEEPGEEARYETHLPVYNLEALAASPEAWAAGAQGYAVEVQGWLPVQLQRRRLNAEMFIGRIVGHSMDNGRNQLEDQRLAVFQFSPKGTRQNKVVLVRGAFHDPDTGTYAVKRYIGDQRGADGRHREIRLVSLNPDKTRYPDITLQPESDADLSIIAELVEPLPWQSITTRQAAQPDPEAQRETRRARTQARLQKALDELMTPPSDADNPSSPTPEGAAARTKPDAATGWESAHILLEAAQGGLMAEVQPLVGLLPFIKTVTLKVGSWRHAVLANNTTSRVWRAPVRPSVERTRFVASPLEEDADVQATMRPLDLRGLPGQTPSVFKVDSRGVGRLQHTRTLLHGHTYRLLIPPAVEVGRDALTEPVPTDPEWQTLTLAITATLSPDSLKQLKAWDLSVAHGQTSIDFGVAPRVWSNLSQAHPSIPCFSPHDPLLLTVRLPNSTLNANITPKGSARLMLMASPAERLPTKRTPAGSTTQSTEHQQTGNSSTPGEDLGQDKFSEGKQVSSALESTAQRQVQSLTHTLSRDPIQHLHLSDLSSGLYAAEVFEQDGRWHPSRVVFRIGEVTHLPPKAFISLRLESSDPTGDPVEVVTLQPGASSTLTGDLTRVGFLSGVAPPCWTIQTIWHGLKETLRLKIQTGIEGSLATDVLERTTQAFFSEALHGALTLDFGEFGQLTLRHEQDLTLALPGIKANLKETLTAIIGNADQNDDPMIQDLWLESVCQSLGYRHNKRSGTYDDDIRALWELSAFSNTPFNKPSSVSPMPWALLVIAHKGSDLASIQPGSLLQRAGQLDSTDQFTRTLVTDGVVWNAFIPQARLRARPCNLHTALAEEDTLAFEDFFNRFMP